MIKAFYKLLGMLSIIMLLIACEEQPIIITPGGGGGQTSDTIFKPILVEDLTGVRCPNCPNGTEKLNELLAVFGKDRIIPIGVHGFFLAAPLEGSKYTFQNPFAFSLERSMSFRGKPAAAFNRVMFEDSEFLAVDEVERWTILAERELTRPAEMTLDFEHTFNNDTRSLTVNASVKGISDVDRVLGVSVFLTQNGLIDKQEDNGRVILDYEHNHVLLGALTPIEGQLLSQSGISSSEELSVTITGTLQEDTGLWHAEDMDVVVFVHTESASTREVYFVKQKKLIE